ncbi:MAG: hypothetical protein RIC55_03440 [Pirellulaceae bacterium]
MPADPTHVVFTCQSCNRAAKADARKGAHWLPWMRRLPIEEDGTCRRCGGDLWCISVLYVESGVDMPQSAADMAVTAALGWQTSTASNRSDYPDVPAEVVARLNENPRERLTRVGAYTQLMERERLRSRGGRDCPTCGAFFVPVADQVWGGKGYCSKVCLVQAEGAQALGPSFDNSDVAPVNPNAIEARCHAGHTFPVQKSFSGMMRPCPVCGAKTRVP